MRSRHYIRLLASIVLIIVAFRELHWFFAPKVGPVGNGLSDSVVTTVWILFGISIVSGVGGVIYFTYLIIRKK